MKNPHLTATVCFALLGMFFELSAWKRFLTRNRKNVPPPGQ